MPTLSLQPHLTRDLLLFFSFISIILQKGGISLLVTFGPAGTREPEDFPGSRKEGPRQKSVIVMLPALLMPRGVRPLPKTSERAVVLPLQPLPQPCSLPSTGTCPGSQFPMWFCNCVISTRVGNEEGSGGDSSGESFLRGEEMPLDPLYPWVHPTPGLCFGEADESLGQTALAQASAFWHSAPMISPSVTEVGCSSHGKEPGAALPSCSRGGKSFLLRCLSFPGTSLKVLRSLLGGGLGTNSISNLETRRKC